jgi:glycosyltransferase involved in cell wall biosynthesis
VRIAFYAPLKPPDHPVPSGDRAVARLLMEALSRAGHQVDLASRFRSRDRAGDMDRQRRIETLGAALSRRLLRRYGRACADRRPDLWFTYHLYYKAPDWIGPTVSRALGIPYVVAEASLAPRRAAGPWSLGHRAAEEALSAADTVVTLNPDDAECLPAGLSQVTLAPFLDAGPFARAAADRDSHRSALARRLALDPASPWLLTVAMMRPGDKSESYRALAHALTRLEGSAWQLVVVGGGPARATVQAMFASPGEGRVRFAGVVPERDLPRYYAASDLMVWPAVNEAFGMALLEAQAAGLPVVAGRVRGVPAVVEDGLTGVLTQPGDAAEFASAVAGLLADPARRRAMAAAAGARVQAGHTLDAAARALDRVVRSAVESSGRAAIA